MSKDEEKIVDDAKVAEKKDEVTFEVVERIGVIATYGNHWSKELNKISWNGAKPKYDIRDWDYFHEQKSRGITLHPEEMSVLKTLISGLDEI